MIRINENTIIKVVKEKKMASKKVTAKKVTKPKNYFQSLEQVDVTKHIQKKGQFKYLSWTFAVREIRRAHPKATWHVHEYKDEQGLTVPYMKTDTGYYIQCTVTVDDVPMTQIHPVLDFRNEAVKQPNAFQINTSIQRCLTKAIALHGLGLHIYAGEDLPPDEDGESQKTSKPVQTPIKALTSAQVKEMNKALEDAKVEKELHDRITTQIKSKGIHQGNFEASLRKIKGIRR